MNIPLRWKKFIERAEKTGYFSRRAKERADNWPTCAVGEIPDALYIDYTYGGSMHPRNAHMRILGEEFMRVVRQDKVATARKIYHRIRSKARILRYL